MVISIGIGEVAALVAFAVLLRNVVSALAPGVVGAAAQAAWSAAIGQSALLCAVAVIYGGLRTAEFNFSERAGYRIVRDLRMEMYRHLQGMTQRQFQGRARGGLLLRFLGDLSMTRLWISRGVLGGTVALVTLVGTLAVLLFFNVWMSLSIIAVLCIGAAVSLGAGHAMRRATRAMRRRRSLVMSNIDEQLNVRSLAQVFGRTAGEYARLSRQNDALTRALVRVAMLRGYMRGTASTFSMLTVGAVLITGLFEVRRGEASIGLVVAFIVVSRQLAGPIRRLGLAHDYWHRAQVSQQKLSEFLRSSGRDLDGEGLERLRARKGAIEFVAATVTGALSELSLTIEAGQLVAVTGGGGAGKSTMLGLVARLVEPDSGSIIIDGQPLDQTTVRSVARRIGMVGPDLPLVRGTVKRNLTYGMPTATPEEVDRVLALCGLDPVLADLPDGIHSWVTEGGRNLSADQRQRIALGRALMGNPPILLLDEPTDGLDRSGAEAFASLMVRHQGTVLLASHDPREIALADTVVVLAGGELQQVISGEDYRDQLWMAEQRGIRWEPTLIS
ncbi:MAG: ABC transporter ATP-binding protein [Cryobacterium sp.]